jgi:hypothetical protein
MYIVPGLAFFSSFPSHQAHYQALHIPCRAWTLRTFTHCTALHAAHQLPPSPFTIQRARRSGL